MTKIMPRDTGHESSSENPETVLKASAHPLAKDVRTRRERFAQEAEILEGIAPVHAFLEKHAEDLVREQPERLHEETLQSMIKSTARLGLYEEAMTWVARYNPATENPDGYLTHGRHLRGDYHRHMDEPDAPLESGNQASRVAFRAHVALMNGDLDEAHEMLREIAAFRAGQTDPTVTMGLRQNGELAVLAYVMGRKDLILPALYRARFAFEPGAEMSTRPLEETPDWIEQGGHKSLYLVNAIAGSGLGPTALALIGERDLDEWGGEMREYYGHNYSYRGLYLSLAHGGCLAEGLELAGQDSMENLRQNLAFLTYYSAAAFGWGDEALGKRLAGEMFEVLKIPGRKFPYLLRDVRNFIREMDSVGQGKWADKVARWMINKAEEEEGKWTADWIKRLPDDEQAAAIEKLRTLEHDHSEKGLDLELAMFGINPAPELNNSRNYSKVVTALREAGETEVARRLLRPFLKEIADHEGCWWTNKSLNECVILGEMEWAVELVGGRPEYARHLGWAVAKQQSWADAFAWTQTLERLDDRLAACAGILEHAAGRLTLCSSLKFQKVSQFPNFRVIVGVGLYPYILEGIGFA